MSCYKFSFGVVEKRFPTHKVVSVLIYDNTKVHVKPLYIEDFTKFKTMVFSPLVKLMELKNFDERKFVNLTFTKKYKIVNYHEPKGIHVTPTVREYLKVVPLFDNVKYLNESFEKKLFTEINY